MPLRDVVALLRADVPILLRRWVVTCAVLVPIFAVSGRYTWWDSVWLSTGLLLLAIPLLPLLWLQSFQGRGRELLHRPGRRKVLAYVFGWAVVSFLPTTFLILAVYRITGLM